MSWSLRSRCPMRLFLRLRSTRSLESVGSSAERESNEAIRTRGLSCTRLDEVPVYRLGRCR
jgi:hypothetical protein